MPTKNRLEAYFLMLALSLLLGGCMAMPVYKQRPVLDPTLTQATLDSGKGIIVGSVLRSEASTSTIYIRDKSGNERKIFIWGDPGVAAYNKLDDFSGGSIFAWSVPPGEYEIYDMELYFNYGTSTKTITPKRKFSIPFHVRASEIVYIGELNVYTLIGKAFFGNSTAVGAVLLQSDKWPRDGLLYASKYPSIDWAKAIFPKLSENTGSEVVFVGRPFSVDR